MVLCPFKAYSKPREGVVGLVPQVKDLRIEFGCQFIFTLTCPAVRL